MRDVTRLLIVDDDQGQLRLLARAISMRRRDLTVLTASHGLEAIDVLESGPVDLVLTDLQMPEMNGFELLAWVLAHQPHVPVFSMTAYPAESVRLTALGSLECFTKPLDIAALLERVSGIFAEGARGHIRNIALPSLLQLLEMERKNCMLAVESGAVTGYLHLEEGAIVDARIGDSEGTGAAITMLGWPSPAITILPSRGARRRTIEGSTSFLILEAMRQEDESSRETDELAALEPVEAPREPAPRPSAPSLSRFPVYLPADARAIALLEATSGRVRCAAGDLGSLDAHAELVATLYRREHEAVRDLQIDDEVEELVLTTRRHWTLVRPVRVEPGSLVMLVFDPDRANLVMERRELASFVVELEAWCAAHAS